ncbi:hypothetical protein NFI96_033829, partial [Prochilodus magdalenae]
AQDGSVQLGCTARYERVDQCSFYPEGDKTNLKSSQTCQLSLTVSELMRWTGRGYSAPEQIKIICFYIGGGSGYSVTSPDSPPAPVTIIAPVRGRGRSLFTSLLVTVPSVRVDYDERRREFSLVCEISLYESLGADVGCNFYIGDETLEWIMSQRTSSSSLACRFLMHETDLSSRLQSARSREMACDFSLSSESTVRSPRSDTYSPTAASSTVYTRPYETTTASLITHSRQDHRIQTPPRRMILVLMLSASCVSILLAGVMIICLCRFTKGGLFRGLHVLSSSGAGEMARLALFSFFCLVLEVRPQNLPLPELSVSPPVVAQDGSVKLGCTAPYERIHQCSFYPQEDKTNLKSSQTCQLSLTGSELIRWTGRGYSSPQQINIICFYTAGESSYAGISPDSRPAPVTIIDAPRLSVSPAGRSHIQLNCTPPYSAGVSRCYFYTEGRERHVKGPSCQISLSVFELIAWANRIYSSPEPIRVTCYYSVRVSHREFLSPHSLPAPVRAL